jgi:hypothetical protein
LDVGLVELHDVRADGELSHTSSFTAAAYAIASSASSP